jgi:Holliday junction resolvasome RuvABC ATP-dependent DNA helicase subunit
MVNNTPKTLDNFFGQKEIIAEVKVLIHFMEQGENFNILLRGSSGYGKTTLARIIAEAVARKSKKNIITEYIPDQTGFIPFDDYNLQQSRVHIIDEVHQIRTPEMFYPAMDSGNNVFLFMTNSSGLLPEPLQNRCISLIFDDYTNEEIGLIVTDYVINELKITLTQDLIMEIVRNSNGNPRVSKMISLRLRNYFITHKYPDTVEELKEILFNFLGIKDGLNKVHRGYLKLLESNDSMSLNLICGLLNVDKGTILYEIEPVLMKRGLISITNKGRQLNFSIDSMLDF